MKLRSILIYGPPVSRQRSSQIETGKHVDASARPGTRNLLRSFQNWGSFCWGASDIMRIILLGGIKRGTPFFENSLLEPAGPGGLLPAQTAQALLWYMQKGPNKGHRNTFNGLDIFCKVATGTASASISHHTSL